MNMSSARDTRLETNWHPCKLTSVRIRGIVERVRKGAARHDAALAMGVPCELFDRWYFIGGQEHKGIYHTLRQEVDKAEAECAVLMAQVIIRAAIKDEDWKAAAHWLGKRRRKDWGDKVEIEETRRIEGEVDVNITLTYEQLIQLPPDQLARMYRQALGAVADTTQRQIEAGDGEG